MWLVLIWFIIKPQKQYQNIRTDLEKISPIIIAQNGFRLRLQLCENSELYRSMWFCYEQHWMPRCRWLFKLCGDSILSIRWQATNGHFGHARFPSLAMHLIYRFGHFSWWLFLSELSQYFQNIEVSFKVKSCETLNCYILYRRKTNTHKANKDQIELVRRPAEKFELTFGRDFFRVHRYKPQHREEPF